MIFEALAIMFSTTGRLKPVTNFQSQVLEKRVHSRRSEGSILRMLGSTCPPHLHTPLHLLFDVPAPMTSPVIAGGLPRTNEVELGHVAVAAP